MPADTIFVFSVVAVAAVLFASNRVRLDVVAMLVVLALMLSGVLTVNESLAGFGDPVVLLVAGLLVVGEMLDRTGVAQSIGNWIIRTGGNSETRLLALIMLAAAALSSVMSSTAVVAIFIPIVFKVAATSGLSASRLLMPMSFAAMVSGMLTLIATTPNLVVSNELAANGFQPLGFFSFAPIGLVVLLVGIVYILLVGRRMLGGTGAETRGSSARSLDSLWEEFEIAEDLQRLRVSPRSSLVDKTIGELEIETRYRVWILAVESVAHGESRGGIVTASAGYTIRAGDLLVAIGLEAVLDEFAEKERLERQPRSDASRRRLLHELGSALVLIHPDCQFIGKSLRQAGLGARYGIHVIGIRRGKRLLEDYADTPLASADTLLVAGSWKDIAKLGGQNHDFVLLEMPAEYEEARPAHRKAPIAIAILLGMVLLSVFDVVPVVAAVLLAAMAGVFTRCLTMEDAYRSISWSSLVLLAGMLPVAVALKKTGGTDLMVDGVVSGIGSTGPYALMTLLFFLTAGLSMFLSNTASAVLLAPVAIQAASALELSPYPFAISVLVGASAAFASPVASPVVTLVVEPGKYRFVDFVKVGGPLMLLTYVVTLIVTPLLFPFLP
jgi:di/tricarboxylate transporter